MPDTRNVPKALPGGRPRAPARASHEPALLGAIAIVGALLLSALLVLPQQLIAPVARRIPQVGEIADHKIKAPDDLEIVDEEASAALRRAAVEQAPAIWDFDDRRLESLQPLVSAAFAAARQAAGPRAEGSTASPAAAFAAALGQNARIPDAALETLAKHGFSSAVEALALEFIGGVVPRMIADDLDELARQIAERPVLVGSLGSRAEPRRLSSADSVLGVDAARARVEERAASRLGDLDAERAAAVLALASALVQPNLRPNLRATEQARQALEAGVKPVVIALRRGEIVVRDGDPITPRHVLLLRGLQRREFETSALGGFLGRALLLLLVFHVLWRFGTTSFRNFRRRPRDAIFWVTVLAGEALAADLGAYVFDAVGDTPLFASLVEELPSLLYFGMPVAAATMLVRMVHNAETAVLFAMASALLAGLAVRHDLGYALFTLAGSLTAAVGAARVLQRGVLLRAGAAVAGANAAVVLGLAGLDPGVSWTAAGVGVLLALASGVLSGVIVSGIAPFVEWLFRYTTDIKLLELANRENSLLRQLEVRAPGTYHHSMMVGHLAEKAAEAIGANALEVKVAAYYHDIGKMRRPQFFVENYASHGGEDRHEKLSASMSARIIQAHVRDGTEMGTQHGLADPIMRGIAQHHGTSIIRFFYEKAKDLADPSKGDVVHEHDYRYPGPRPQTREAGILMLADSVEAASRTLAEPGPARIQQLVQRIINNYFRDGQLDECSLTLRDLHAIARSFIETLSAIRHERIDYPEATDALGRRLEGEGDEGLAERAEAGARDRSEPASSQREGGLRRLGID